MDHPGVDSPESLINSPAAPTPDSRPIKWRAPINFGIIALLVALSLLAVTSCDKINKINSVVRAAKQLPSIVIVMTSGNSSDGSQSQLEYTNITVFERLPGGSIEIAGDCRYLDVTGLDGRWNNRGPDKYTFPVHEILQASRLESVDIDTPYGQWPNVYEKVKP